MSTKVPYPHEYKTQRRMEREAGAKRQEMLSSGKVTKLPMVCGYTYLTRPTKQQRVDPAWHPEPVVCMRAAGAGTDHQGRGFCDYHTAEAANNLARAPKQLQAARQHALQQSSFFGTPTYTDPHQVILDEIARSARIVAWIDEQMMAERDRGVPEKEIMQAYSKQKGFQPSVWAELHAREREHLVRTATAAIKAGIAERKVRIAEQQGMLIVAMMQAFIHDPELGLTPDQMLRAPVLMRKHLLNLPNEDEQSVDPQRILEAHAVEL